RSPPAPAAEHPIGAPPATTLVDAMRRDLSDIVEPGWAMALEPVADQIRRMGDFLRAELAAGRRFLPDPDRIFAAFQTPFDRVRVLIVGQDPYPTVGHPIGLCFSVAPHVRPL